MSKIGVIINRVSQGATTLYVSEGAKKWESEARDTRNDLKKINIEKLNHDDLHSSYMDFITFGENVVLIFVNRFLAGRPGDSLSAMITVPGDVLIKGKDLESIIIKTKEILLSSTLSRDELEQLFSKDYPLKLVPGNSSSNTGLSGKEEYAYRKYGIGTQFNLNELLDSLFQPYYYEYKAVFLIDNSSPLEMEDGATDLTEKKLYKYVLLQYPKDVPNDIKIFVNNEIFTKNKTFKEGEVVNITLERKGFCTKSEEIKLNDEINKIDLNKYEWKLKIPYSWFILKDKETNKEIAEFFGL